VPDSGQIGGVMTSAAQGRLRKGDRERMVPMGADQSMTNNFDLQGSINTAGVNIKQESGQVSTQKNGGMGSMAPQNTMIVSENQNHMSMKQSPKDNVMIKKSDSVMKSAMSSTNKRMLLEEDEDEDNHRVTKREPDGEEMKDVDD
jgi:hypothetical protein